MSDPKITVDEAAQTLTIVLPLQNPTPSKSGKNLTVASTFGLLRTDAKVNGRTVTVGVNAFIPLK